MPLATLFAASMVLTVLAFLLFAAWRSTLIRRARLWRVAWSHRPRPLVGLFAGTGLALCLGACAALGGVGQPAAYRATQSFIVAETAFDTAVVTADMAVNSGLLPAATIARIKADVDTGYGYVKLGRAAVTAGDAVAAGTNATALQALVADLTALTKT